MRNLNLRVGQDAEYNVLMHTVLNRGYSTKEAKTARRLIRKMKAVGYEDTSQQFPMWALSPQEQGAADYYTIALEEAEFRMLKTSFENQEGWLPKVIEAVGVVQDLLDECKEND